MGEAASLRTESHFDNIADRYYPIVDSVWYDIGYYHRREAECLGRLLGTGFELVVDAGCGPGRHAFSAAMNSRRVVALDLSRRMLEVARERTPEDRGERLNWIHADVMHLPLKDRVADLIINMEVLEHLPQGLHATRQVFREFRRVLRPRGLLVVETPLLRHSWWSRAKLRGPSWKEVSPMASAKYYTGRPLPVDTVFKDEVIENQLSEAGFRVLARRFVRVIPSGIVELFPLLEVLDALLEKLPVLRRLAREVIWVAVNSGSGIST